MRKAGLYSLFVMLCASLSASAAIREECGAVASKSVGGKVAYCVLLPASYDAQKTKRFPVLYMLHGLGDSAQNLLSNGVWAMVEDLANKKAIGDFVIIAPNGGRSFYINSKDGRVRYEDFFAGEFLPAMEKKYRIQTNRAGRGITGISMGGYGALRTAFKHPQLFGSVSAHMPALLEKMPKGAGNAGLNAFLGGSFGTPLDAAFWDRNTPFVFAKSNDLRGLKIYFDCGDQDDFGFDKGTQDLDRLLTARKVPHESHIYPGNHGMEYVAQHLDASLKFHSRAFGLTR